MAYLRSFWNSLLTVSRPDEAAELPRRRAHCAWLYGWLAVLGIGIGVLSLLLTACSAGAAAEHAALFSSYFRSPWLLGLNLFVPVVLVFLGFFLFRQPWAAYLFSAAPCLLLSFGTYYKVQLRGDPVLATDIKLLRTAGGIVGHYTLELTKPVVIALCAAAAMLLFSVFLLRAEPMRGRLRPLGALVCATALLGAYFTAYTSESVYAERATNGALPSWAEAEPTLSRGTIYPFLHSIPALFPASPDGYAEQEAEDLLAQYTDADIPENETVTVVGVMLEAFCDLTDFPALADIPAVQEVYAPLHELEERCISGNLLTNIFAGGTTDTEWAFLTGYSRHDDFLSDTDSFVRYFKAQGYDTLYRHPGYNWFYDRVNVNEYLGFDESVFQENGFSDLISMNDALYYSDAVLYDYLLADLDARGEVDAPLFLFSVTYQNHGPYPTDTYWMEYVTPEETGWSYESCCIINNYLVGIERTVSDLSRLAEELEAREEPVVLVFFGDHKPWLGNGNSVYAELGISLDQSTREGFYNYFSTPYGIFANSAARSVLGGTFTGDGGDFSPCFLMAKLFDVCGWEGNSFLQLQRAVREELPVISSLDHFFEDGALTDSLSEERAQLFERYRYVEYYREHGLSAAAETEEETA